MTISAMTAKSLKLAIKNGSTPEDLQKKYECSDEDLRKRISQLYNQGKSKVSQDLYAELEANRKKHHRKAESEPEEVSDQPTAEEEAPPAAEKKSLEDLQAEEKILSDTLIELEGRHKDLAMQRRPYKKNLEEIQSSIDEIKAQLERYNQEFEECLREANLLAEEMNNLCVPIREKRVALEKLRQEIENRQTVTLFIYEDGRIEAPDNPEFVLNDEGYQDLKAVLSEREECLDLKLRDIATLARLFVIARYTEKIVLACENDELEKAFHAIRGE